MQCTDKTREISGVLTRGQCQIRRQVAGVGGPEFHLTNALGFLFGAFNYRALESFFALTIFKIIYSVFCL